jgi:hypothetical protein
VQPALEVAQDVNLFTGEIFKRKELGEVKLSILKEGKDNACLECRDDCGLSSKIFRPATYYQVGKHSSLKEKIRFDRRALFVTSLLQSRMPFSDYSPITNYRVKRRRVGKACSKS